MLEPLESKSLNLSINVMMFIWHFGMFTLRFASQRELKNDFWAYCDELDDFRFKNVSQAALLGVNWINLERIYCLFSEWHEVRCKRF